MAASKPTPAAPPTLDLLSDLADLAWFRVDGDRNVVEVSPAMERLTGFEADQVVGRSCIVLNRCEECLKGCGVFEAGAVRDAPLSLFRADGTSVEVRKSGRVIRDARGAIVGAVEVVRPDEAGPEAAPGPPQAAGRLDPILGALGRAWLLADAAFRVVDHGTVLADLAGRPGSDLRGTPVSALLGADLFDPGASFRGALEAGQRREGWRATLARADGSGLPVSLSVGAIDEPDACEGPCSRYAVVLRPEERTGQVPSFHGIVARSSALQRIFRVVELLRDNDSTVLVTGESGTGKELVARAIHRTSHRRDGPFVAVNCAAIPEDLLESELFGHVRGSFTGAVKDRVGRVELADGGTLFLDEIGDLALSLQGKILRFLQEHTFERVGDSRTRSVDVRIIAATHVNLVQAVSDRRFREDLYYRLRVVPLHIPPLRERRDDLELLVRHLLERIGRERGRSLRLAPSASRALLTHDWPGNVRELQSALEYATAVCEGQTIHLADLPHEVVGGAREPGSAPEPAASAPDPGTTFLGVAGGGRPGRFGPNVGADAGPNAVPDPAGPARTPADAAEARAILDALARTRFRREEAARLLGISRTTLWRRMKELDL